MSAVIVVGAIWMLAGGAPGNVLGPLRLPLIAVLICIPFVADAKQVIAAMPAIVLATRWRRGARFGSLARVAVAVGSVFVLFAFIHAGKASEQFITEAQRGHGGKQAAAALVWDKLRADPAALAFGKGPAETVSRAAFMTTPNFQVSGFENTRSPLAVLGLKPAAIATEAQLSAVSVSGGRSSLNTGVSSALGVLGDLGLFGFTVYVGLVLTVLLRLRRENSPEGVAAAAGFAMFIVLGLVFDWWEQPPFGVLLGTLAGLAIAQTQWNSQTAAVLGERTA